CLRDDFTNYKGSDISWVYNGYSTDPNGPFEKGCYYEFDGVDDFLQAQNASDLDFALPIKVDLEFDTKIGFILGKPLWGGANNRHQLSVRSSETNMKFIITNSNNSQNVALEYPKSSLNTGQRYEISIDEDGADLVLFIDS